MRLTPEDELRLLSYLNNLKDPKTVNFAMWKIEPADGALVFINDGPTNGDFTREKTEAEIQLGKSGFNNDLKTRVINALIGFAGKTRVVGVAVRDQLLVQEMATSIKTIQPAGGGKASGSKRLIH